MRVKKISRFIGDLPRNIFAGFVVSLIALPLGLGLAGASQAPPIAGILAAFTGGIIVAIFGGSNVTIVGPGNGMVVVLLSAITTLGGEDSFLGYQYTLAAIVIAGFLMVLLGFFKMDILSDFFPSAAIQGMLAAIGIGILAKQYHLMLGHFNINGTTLSLLKQIPESTYRYFFTDFNHLVAGGVGIFSLLLMIFYPKIRIKWIQLIPAPMWIVIAVIGMHYYYDFFTASPYPIAEKMLVKIPENITNSFTFPNFSKVLDADFIAVIFSIAFVSSIESLLSIKAVDKLDTQNRKSNVNKDLKALGLASIVSGFLGGLNVVTVIARSSINVNNRATNRSANFFHAFFLIVFILLFQNQLRKIPTPALAAILVFTGYKLANPTNINAVFRVGKEQFFIFIFTLIMTLVSNLITGILSGIFATVCIHFLINKNIGFFLRHILKPNVLLFQENEGIYYVNIRHFCTFMNYYKLKSKLEQIPAEKDTVVDFSSCRFVDNTVMENIESYRKNFYLKGGNFEVTGLDLHRSKTAHPFAIRKISHKIENFKAKNLTKRQKTLQITAQNFHWDYIPFPEKQIDFINKLPFFKQKNILKIKNLLCCKTPHIKVFDVVYTEGAFIAQQEISCTMLYLQTKHTVPNFSLDKEGFFEHITHLGDSEVLIKNHPDFSKTFCLFSDEKTATEKFFIDELVLFFESNAYFHIENNRGEMLIFNRQRIYSVKEIKELIDFTIRLNSLLEKVS